MTATEAHIRLKAALGFDVMVRLHPSGKVSLWSWDGSWTRDNKPGQTLKELVEKVENERSRRG